MNDGIGRLKHAVPQCGSHYSNIFKTQRSNHWVEANANETKTHAINDQVQEKNR